MTWRDYQVLRTVLAAGGYAEAATRLNLTHPTVRACVERIETTLRSPLFTHSPEGLTATAAARALMPSLDRMALAATLFDRLSTGPVDGARGVVRVGGGLLAEDEVLPPLWKALMSQNPGLILEVVADRQPDESAVLGGVVDVGVSGEQPISEEIDSWFLGSLVLGLYAHRDYLAAAGTPLGPGDLGRFAMIGPLDDAVAELWAGRLGLRHEDLSYAYRGDHRPGHLAMALAGVGVGMFPIFTMASRPDMVRVLPDLRATTGVWLMTRKDMAGVRRVRLVRDAMLSLMGVSGQG